MRKKGGGNNAPTTTEFRTLYHCCRATTPFELTDSLRKGVMRCVHHSQSRGAALFFEHSEQFLITFSVSTSTVVQLKC